MTPFVLWVALAWGVDAGYEPAPDGHLEYIIQIEPQLLSSLAAGHNVTSEVPGGLDVRHYRLSVGTAALPRIAAPTAGGRPSTAGGVPARAADQFETPGRVDEAIGTTTPQIRVGWQALAPAGGQYVIEIDPHSLTDLNLADLTGDIPPGLPVTRFVISTTPGSAASVQPTRSGRAAMAPPTAAVPAMVGTAPAAIDEDSSSWQPEVPTATAGSPPASGGLPPTLATVPPVPDDAPGGEVAPPAAMPPHRNATDEPAGESPSTPATAGPAYLDPPGGNFRHKGSGAGRTAEHDPAAETAPASGAAPGHLPFEAASGPLVTPTAGVDDAEPEGRAHGTRKPPTADREKGDAPAPEPGAADRKGEAKETATKPWLPFTLALLALFASLGGNVFLGWIAWESYNRSPAVMEKPAGRKPSLSS